MAASRGAGPDGRQARWDRHNLARRQRILDAAVDVLEAAPVGEDVHVAAIAERAGLSRTVVYRHFDDRADLDRAVRGLVLEQLRAELVPVLSLDGTPVDIVERIVGAYVGWAAAHPALHRFAEREAPGSGPSQMDEAVGQIARQIEDLINVAVQVLGIDLDQDDRAALDPLVFGLVGGVFTAVRRWVSRPVREPAPEQLVSRLTEAVYHQIAGLARARGVTLAADVPLEELLAAAFDDVEETR